MRTCPRINDRNLDLEQKMLLFQVLFRSLISHLFSTFPIKEQNKKILTLFRTCYKLYMHKSHTTN